MVKNSALCDSIYMKFWITKTMGATPATTYSPNSPTSRVKHLNHPPKPYAQSMNEKDNDT